MPPAAPLHVAPQVCGTAAVQHEGLPTGSCLWHRLGRRQVLPARDGGDGAPKPEGCSTFTIPGRLCFRQAVLSEVVGCMAGWAVGNKQFGPKKKGNPKTFRAICETQHKHYIFWKVAEICRNVQKRVVRQSVKLRNSGISNVHNFRLKILQPRCKANERTGRSTTFWENLAVRSPRLSPWGETGLCSVGGAPWRAQHPFCRTCQGNGTSRPLNYAP